MNRRDYQRLKIREAYARRAYRKRAQALVVREQRKRYLARIPRKGLLRKTAPPS